MAESTNMYTNKIPASRKENDILLRMLKAVLLKAVKGTALTAQLNNTAGSIIGVADQYLEMK